MNGTAGATPGLWGVAPLTLLMNRNVTHSRVTHSGYVVSLYAETATYYKKVSYHKQITRQH